LFLVRVIVGMLILMSLSMRLVSFFWPPLLFAASLLSSVFLVAALFF